MSGVADELLALRATVNDALAARIAADQANYERFQGTLRAAVERLRQIRWDHKVTFREMDVYSAFHRDTLARIEDGDYDGVQQINGFAHALERTLAGREKAVLVTAPHPAPEPEGA